MHSSHRWIADTLTDVINVCAATCRRLRCRIENRDTAVIDQNGSLNRVISAIWPRGPHNLALFIDRREFDKLVPGGEETASFSWFNCVAALIGRNCETHAEAGEIYDG